MNNPIRPFTASHLAFLAASTFVVGLTWSPFLLTLSQALTVLASIWHVISTAGQQGQAPTWGKALGASFKRLWHQPTFLLMSLLFLVPATSYFWSDYLPGWRNFTRIRLPFLFLPWAFANMPPLSGRQMKTVLFLLLITMVVICIGVGINFAIHYTQMVEDLKHGRPIPVPRNHIRFSLTLACAIFSGAWLFMQNFYIRFKWERYIQAICVLFLFGFIHLLSVRSGIAALYAGLVFTVFWSVFRTGRWKIGLAALAFIVALPIAAIKFIPSLQERINYMVYDWQKYRNNEGGTYSDSDRFVSLHIGYLLWKEQPITGTGSGDLQMEAQRMANDRFPRYSLDPKLPHNQFVYILAGTGLFGIILSLVALIAPFFLPQARRFYLFILFQIIVFLSFMVEYTLETAIGVGFYLFFTLWFWKMATLENASKNLE